MIPRLLIAAVIFAAWCLLDVRELLRRRAVDASTDLLRMHDEDRRLRGLPIRRITYDRRGVVVGAVWQDSIRYEEAWFE